MSEPVELVVYQGRGEEHREPTFEELIEAVANHPGLDDLPEALACEIADYWLNLGWEGVSE